MAKISFSKLGLTRAIESKSIEFNEQTIEIKQYLSVNEKLELISNVINSSADDNNFANPVKLEIFTALEILYHYTNINFTDKQKEDPSKLYDLVKMNGLIDAVTRAIPVTEQKNIYSAVKDCAEAVYTYRNSVFGILDTISADYSALDLDASSIQAKLADPENMALLKQVLTKLG